MTADEVAAIFAEELRTNDALRRSLKMQDGDESGRIDGEPAIGFTDGDGDQHFLTVETA